jgi:hypothetical protein
VLKVHDIDVFYGLVPALHRVRLEVEAGAQRVYNFLHAMTLELQMIARGCGKTNVHSLEPEDLAALTVEAAAMCRVPLAGTQWTPGVDPQQELIAHRLERLEREVIALRRTLERERAEASGLAD